MNLKLGPKKLGPNSSNSRLRPSKKPIKRKKRRANNIIEIVKKAPPQLPKSTLSRPMDLIKRKRMMIEVETKTVWTGRYIT